MQVLTSTATTAYLGSCVDVEAAEGFSLALGANGRVCACGSQDYSQLGDHASSGSRGYAQPFTTDATGNPDLTRIIAIPSAPSLSEIEHLMPNNSCQSKG